MADEAMTPRERAADRILKVWRHGRDIGDTAANAIDMEFATDFVDAVLEEIAKLGQRSSEIGAKTLADHLGRRDWEAVIVAARKTHEAVIDAIKRGEG